MEIHATLLRRQRTRVLFLAPRVIDSDRIRYAIYDD